MSYQVCPTCNGRGTMFSIFYEGKSYEVTDFPRMEMCRTCRGTTVFPPYFPISSPTYANTKNYTVTGRIYPKCSSPMIFNSKGNECGSAHCDYIE